MLTKMSLYVYTKNSNLHAVSALEAIHDLLQQDAVVSLNRYIKWDICFSLDKTEASEQLDKIISKSFYILNPNKEGYYLDHVPKIKSGIQRFVHVKRDFDLDQSDIMTKINHRFGHCVVSLEKSYVWDIHLSESCDDQCVLDHIVASTSTEKGILVNPLYETYSVLETI